MTEQHDPLENMYAIVFMQLHLEILPGTGLKVEI